jgi:hypothetical protein
MGLLHPLLIDPQHKLSETGTKTFFQAMCNHYALDVHKNIGILELYELCKEMFAHIKDSLHRYPSWTEVEPEIPKRNSRGLFKPNYEKYSKIIYDLQPFKEGSGHHLIL